MHQFQKKPAKVRHSDTRHGDYTDAGRGEKNTGTSNCSNECVIDVSAKDVQREALYSIDLLTFTALYEKRVVEQENDAGWI